MAALGPPPSISAEASHHTLRIVHAFLIASMLVYMWLPSHLRVQPRPPLNPVFYGALVALALVLVGVIVLIRNLMLQRSLEQLALRPDDSALIRRWHQGYLIIFCLCEAIVLYGFVLRLVGATLLQSAPFYLGGLVLMLCFTPKRLAG